MSMFVRAALATVAGFAFLAMPATAADEKPKLDGQHQITAGERDGKPMAENALKGCTFRFAGEKVVAATKDGTAFLTAEYTLDSAKKPCVIVMKLTEGTDKGKELKGLIERTGDKVKLLVDRDVDLDGLLARARAAGEVRMFSYEPPKLSELFMEAVTPEAATETREVA
jgi:uncharacterized protein (TIGR03067 family)